LNLGAKWTCNVKGSWVDAFNETLTEDLVCADLCTGATESINAISPKGVDSSHCVLSALQKTCAISACRQGYSQSGSAAGSVVCDDTGPILKLNYVPADVNPFTCTLQDICSSAADKDLPDNFPESVIVDVTNCGFTDAASAASCDIGHFSCDEGSALQGKASLTCLAALDRSSCRILARPNVSRSHALPCPPSPTANGRRP